MIGYLDCVRRRTDRRDATGPILQKSPGEKGGCGPPAVPASRFARVLRAFRQSTPAAAN